MADAKKLEFLTGKKIVAVYLERDVLEIAVNVPESEKFNKVPDEIYRFRYDPIGHNLFGSKVEPITKSFLHQRDLDRTLGIETEVPINTVHYSN
jgi:hypothetical protein